MIYIFQLDILHLHVQSLQNLHRTLIKHQRWMYAPVPQSYPSAHWKNWHCLFFLCLHVKKRRPLLGPTLSTSTTRMVHGNPWPLHSGNPTSADCNIVTTELFNWCNWSLVTGMAAKPGIATSQSFVEETKYLSSVQLFEF